MRHRQAASDDLAAGHVDDHAAVARCSRQPSATSLRPTSVTIGRAAVAHGQAVEVAAVLGGELRDEGRPPQRREAVRRARPRQAGEERVDEDRPPARVDRDVVDVEVAGGVAHLRHVEPVVARLRLARAEHVLEAPELVERAHPQRLAVAGQAHAAVEGALEDRQPAVGLQADQEQLAGLVGGEGEARALLGEPREELAGGGDRKCRRAALCASVACTDLPSLHVRCLTHHSARKGMAGSAQDQAHVRNEIAGGGIRWSVNTNSSCKQEDNLQSGEGRAGGLAGQSALLSFPEAAKRLCKMISRPSFCWKHRVIPIRGLPPSAGWRSIRRSWTIGPHGTNGFKISGGGGPPAACRRVGGRCQWRRLRRPDHRRFGADPNGTVPGRATWSSARPRALRPI